MVANSKMRKEQSVAGCFPAASFCLTRWFNTACIWDDAGVQLHRVFQAVSSWASVTFLFLGYRILGRGGVPVTVGWVRNEQRC